MVPILLKIYTLRTKKFINYFENLNYNFSIIDIYHEKNIANNCLILITKETMKNKIYDCITFYNEIF